MTDMTEILSKPCTAFEGQKQLLSGPMIEVALAIKNAMSEGKGEPILSFDDETGRVIDFDLRGTKAEIIARLSQNAGVVGSDAKAPASPPSAEPSSDAALRS